jgi:hypothetical protein
MKQTIIALILTLTQAKAVIDKHFKDVKGDYTNICISVADQTTDDVINACNIISVNEGF